MAEKPLAIEESTIEYLHQLRKSGAVNMMGAGEYLMRDLGLDKQEAKEITLAYLFGNFTKK